MIFIFLVKIVCFCYSPKKPYSMEQNQEELLKNILQILDRCDPLETKSMTTANNLITYIGYAYNKKLYLVPESYREFAQQIKNNYPEFRKRKTNQEKVELLKRIVSYCHVLIESN